MIGLDLNNKEKGRKTQRRCSPFNTLGAAMDKINQNNKLLIGIDMVVSILKGDPIFGTCTRSTVEQFHPKYLPSFHLRLAGTSAWNV